MKKVFISQPMAGKKLVDIEAERCHISTILEEAGFELINNIDAVEPKTDGSKLISQAVNIIKMSLADYIYFMPGWESARGCRIEHTIAKEYNKKIIYNLNEIIGGYNE